MKIIISFIFQAIARVIVRKNDEIFDDPFYEETENGNSE